MSIKDRVQAPTPPFYRKLRNAGLAGVAIATSLLAAPIGVPAIVTKIAGYLMLAGTVVSAVSQTVTGKDEKAAQ